MSHKPTQTDTDIATLLNDVDINDLTYQVNAAIFEVNRELGPGFLEKVYENALLIELREMRAPFSSAMSAEENVCVGLWPINPKTGRVVDGAWAFVSIECAPGGHKTVQG